MICLFIQLFNDSLFDFFITVKQSRDKNKIIKTKLMVDLVPRQLLNCGWIELNYQPHFSVKCPSGLPIIHRFVNMYTMVSEKFKQYIKYFSIYLFFPSQLYITNEN